MCLLVSTLLSNKDMTLARNGLLKYLYMLALTIHLSLSLRAHKPSFDNLF